MKAWQFFTVLLLAVIAAGLSVALVFTARGNADLQQSIEARQVQLNRSVLTPQAQQIASGILQDMGRVAVTNAPMRQLLAKHGYTVQAGAANTPAAAAPSAPATQEEKP